MACYIQCSKYLERPPDVIDLTHRSFVAPSPPLVCREQFDMFKLRNELISLFTVDSIRRVLTECVVPLITQVRFDGAGDGRFDRLAACSSDCPDAA